jgi:2-oxoisovalerate dehydrogenase E2 component (dihydrolipoyl transacylase)
MAKFAFRLPDIGEGIAEAEIVAWHVKIGDQIEEDQPLADLMTDKATVEMAAPVSGTLVERAGEVGDVIAIGSTLATFDINGADPGPETDAAGAPEPDKEVAVDEGPVALLDERRAPVQRVLASPAVRARAMDLGLDLSTIKPAHGERIRHGDLDAFLRYAGKAAAVPAIADGAVETIKIAGLRRKIAEKMAESKQHIPHFSYVEECDVTELERLRAVLNMERGQRPKLTLLPFLIRALVRAASEFPMVNARYDDDGGVVTRHGAVHLGLATQTPDGLMVPVIRNAAQHDLWALAGEVVRLSEGAKAGKLKAQELSGSTITLSSLGALGGIVSTPIINRPEVAIVGVNRIVERPALVDGQLVQRKLMNLSSSFDHRIVDGYDAARFIQAIRRLLETPALIFT